MMTRDLDLNQASCGERIDTATVDVRDEITETIDPEYDPRELSTRHSRFWNVEQLPGRDPPT